MRLAQPTPVWDHHGLNNRKNENSVGVKWWTVRQIFCVMPMMLFMKRKTRTTYRDYQTLHLEDNVRTNEILIFWQRIICLRKCWSWRQQRVCMKHSDIRVLWDIKTKICPIIIIIYNILHIIYSRNQARNSWNKKK